MEDLKPMHEVGWLGAIYMQLNINHELTSNLTTLQSRFLFWKPRHVLKISAEISHFHKFFYPS